MFKCAHSPVHCKFSHSLSCQKERQNFTLSFSKFIVNCPTLYFLALFHGGNVPLASDIPSNSTPKQVNKELSQRGRARSLPQFTALALNNPSSSSSLKKNFNGHGEDRSFGAIRGGRAAGWASGRRDSTHGTWVSRRAVPWRHACQ